VAVRQRVADDHQVPPEVVAAVFHGVSLSDAMGVLVLEQVAGVARVRWGNARAGGLLGFALEDLAGLPAARLFPTLEGTQLRLLLRRERAVGMDLPVRCASGALVDCAVMATPVPGGRRWSLRLASTANETERALRASADAHERRFSTLTERSPVPTLLSEQGMRLAHVNDAFCALVGRQAEELLGTGWLGAVHPDDLDAVVEQAAIVLGGDPDDGEAETQARLVRADGTERTTVLRFSHLFTPGVGAGFVGTIEDITDRLASEARLAHQAVHDPLTGLPNRTLLAEHVAARFRPGDARLACVFLDLDDFKVVNDSLGHAAGDQLLVELARRLEATVRPGDLVARFGGDEFVVVCEDLTEQGAVALAERIGAALRLPVTLDGVELRPAASVGVTVQTAEHTAAEELIRDCDIAMYQAKAAGKGRITVLDSHARAQAHDELRLVAELREAIERREVTCAYQPIVSTADGTAVAVESLARWSHPGRGAISPATFVPLAERSGLVSGLGLLVLDETCRQLAAWDRELGAAAPARANVNVSALQLDAELHGHVASALRRHGLQPCRLSIELTESALMKDPDAARQVLLDLRALGVQISIDDFGTGYSSLAYLRHLPVDCLKVDRSFVAEMADGHPEITEAVIALARSLGLCTVAEGVETLAQAEQLTGLGADFLQGFGLAAPLSGTDATAWFAARHTSGPTATPHPDLETT
jgi:diguanylate cyclase (GGDEF)-like protein/PAS domain S-box-containing protein